MNDFSVVRSFYTGNFDNYLAATFDTSIEPCQPAHPACLTGYILLADQLQVSILISCNRNLKKIEGGLFHLRNSAG